MAPSVESAFEDMDETYIDFMKVDQMEGSATSASDLGMVASGSNVGSVFQTQPFTTAR